MTRKSSDYVTPKTRSKDKQNLMCLMAFLKDAASHTDLKKLWDAEASLWTVWMGKAHSQASAYEEAKLVLEK